MSFSSFFPAFLRALFPCQPRQQLHEHRRSLGCAKHDLSKGVVYLNPCCDFSFASEKSSVLSHEPLPVYSEKNSELLTTDVLKTIEQTVDTLDSSLRNLSLSIHGHPELMFQEKYAHDLLTSFMEGNGFRVTRHYLGLETAWRAEFQHLKGGRTIGINSEMDALQGMGHACGHNLIAVSGVGVALALKAALQTHNIPGKVVLLGTPAEEGGGGKVIMLERGGYKGMDACIMCHPGAGRVNSASIGSTTAMQAIEVEFFGQSAHAGAAPWEGTNAQDAAFLAYSNISVLRQQMKPDHRVHGVIQGTNWVPNIIPDYAQMRWYVRAPTSKELLAFVERVKKCFEAAALATSCTVKLHVETPYFDLHQNEVLAHDFVSIVGSRYGMSSSVDGTSASTDFGNVTYELPAFHPMFTIPTKPHGGNHTPAFAEAAASKQAHEATMLVTKALALTGFRVVADTGFFAKVKGAFDAWKNLSA
ncbi:amidohydrolase [Macrolepiota fuliginosa MF-IS2]|uniref:Amidohydrolase n=1 Tax=Macrolepiota fuliginosa MF-IS2 TaxID=1400762 RepID=A0A9P6CAN2_9AGAR|nr:amidohydrolase [Macrolepiota fuliginosa MF-IS2]